MDNNFDSVNSLDIKKKDIHFQHKTWAETWRNVILGYVTLIFVFCSMGYYALTFFSSGELDTRYNKENFIEALLFLSGIYTFYVVTQIICFSLRKNGYFVVVYGSIRRFFDDYVWCLCVVFIPFLVWNHSPNSVYCDISDIDSIQSLVFVSYICCVILSQYLVPLILLQRIVITCYLASTKKTTWNLMDNDRLWQSLECPVPLTLRNITCNLVLRIRDQFCFWFAVLVFMTVIPILVMNSWLLAIKDNGNAAMAGAFMVVAIEHALFIVVCCLVFCIALRNSFTALRQCVHLWYNMKASWK